MCKSQMQCPRKRTGAKSKIVKQKQSKKVLYVSTSNARKIPSVNNVKSKPFHHHLHIKSFHAFNPPHPLPAKFPNPPPPPPWVGMTMYGKGKKGIAIDLRSRSDPKGGSVGTCPGNFFLWITTTSNKFEKWNNWKLRIWKFVNSEGEVITRVLLGALSTFPLKKTKDTAEQG